jgi:hypothetical protein
MQAISKPEICDTDHAANDIRAEKDPPSLFWALSILYASSLKEIIVVPISDVQCIYTQLNFETYRNRRGSDGTKAYLQQSI